MGNTSRDIIRYFCAVASEDPEYSGYIHLFVNFFEFPQNCDNNLYKPIL